MGRTLLDGFDISQYPVGVSQTEIGYLDGVTSGIQAQIDAIKEAKTFSAIVKKADETVTSSTVMQDDDELTVALSANKSYGFLLVLKIISPAAADFKYNLTVFYMEIFGPSEMPVKFSGFNDRYCAHVIRYYHVNKQS